MAPPRQTPDQPPTPGRASARPDFEAAALHLERLAVEKDAAAAHLGAGLPGPRSRSQAELGRRHAEALRYAARALRKAAE